MEKKAPPVDRIEVENLEAAIWLNDTKEGPMLSYTLQRVYSVNGERKRSNSFGRRDSKNVSKLVKLANEYITKHDPKEFVRPLGTVQQDAPEAVAEPA